jgi:putative heme-binding domain-containing protein
MTAAAEILRGILRFFVFFASLRAAFFAQRRKERKEKQELINACFTTGLALVIIGAVSHSLHAQAIPTDVPDPDPEIERRSFQLADGFEVNLFAADPLLAKPIQMNFDAAGRLWVACSEVYPQIRPGQKANDKVIILEDRAGTGRADKTTVFADGLLIPTGLVPGDGGVYVGTGTQVLFLSDTDGDGKADRRQVVLSGFGTQDTHHLIHTFHWGPDGLLYFNQSIYIYSTIESPYGVRRLAGGGIWQYRPETGRLEVFARGWANPWGHQFDRWGQSFVTDGAGDQGVSYVVPRASYSLTFPPEVAPVPPRVLEGMTPHSPKYCGHEILSGRHLPEDWRGNILANDFRGHRVCRFVVREEGSGYAVQEKAELIKTNHAAFRPVDVKMGPDGAIYIADWYNPIINHGEVDFRDPRRDHVHGRIWRVTAKGRPLVKRPQLVGASTEALLQALKAPEDWTRHHAKRLLKERGSRVLPAVREWVQRLDTKDADYEHQLLEALWTFQSLDVTEPSLLDNLLNARDHHARAAATRVIQYWHPRLANPLELLAARVNDDGPQVRLEAVRALDHIADVRSMELAMQALDRPMDQYLDYALWQTARELAAVWLPAFQTGRLEFAGSARHLAFVLEAIGSQEALQPLVSLFRSGNIKEPSEVDRVLTLMAALGGPAKLEIVFEQVRRPDFSSARQAHLLAALDQAAKERGVRPAGDLGQLGALLDSKDEQVQGAAARLAGRWNVEALRPKLVELAQSDKSSETVRQAAMDGLVLLGGQQTRETLERLAEKNRPPVVRNQAVVSLAGIDLKSAAQSAADFLAVEVNPAYSEKIFTAFIERKNGPAALAEALKGRSLLTDVAKIGARTLRGSGRDAPALLEVLMKAGASSVPKHSLSAEEMAEMVADVLKHGDPARGEAVFRRKDQACLKCHAIGGAGGQVGPDLSSIGASAPIDYLIESILLPSKAIKENYHSVVVTLKDGRFVTGIKVRETKTELVLRTAEDQEVAVPTKDIEDQQLGNSLMPEGLADTLTRGELIDLVRFLSELGKVGPYSLSKARLVRRWQVMETPSTWGPAYSRIDGTLPLDAVPRLDHASQAHGLQPVGLRRARCPLDVSVAGKIKLLLNSATGLTIWIDDRLIKASETLTLDLKPGLRTLTFAIDPTRRDGLRCELADLSDSSARVRIVGGK